MTTASRKTGIAAALIALATAAAAPGAVAQTTGTVGTTGSVGPTGAVGGGAVTTADATPSTTSVPASPAEQEEVAEQIVSNATNLSRRLTQMLDEARREADMIRVNCLNDKLTQVNANLRNAQSRLESLKKATDTDLRNHEYTVISVLGQKLQLLDQEANQCVGQDMYETGATKVTTEIDSSMMPFEADPSEPPTILAPTVFDVPPNASSSGGG